MSKMNFVEVQGVYKHHTDRAVIFAADDEEHNVPRSTLSTRTDDALKNMVRGEEYTFRIHDWKAKQIGLG